MIGPGSLIKLFLKGLAVMLIVNGPAMFVVGMVNSNLFLIVSGLCFLVLGIGFGLAALFKT